MVENLPEDAGPALEKANLGKQRLIIAGIVAAVILFLGLIALAIWGLLQNSATTANIRDIFLIFLAFESLVIGVALVILIIQVASLINLLQNEVRPIIKSTSDTINTLRGTTEFLSENMVEPVIKLNSYLAGLRKVTNLIDFKKR